MGGPHRLDNQGEHAVSGEVSQMLPLQGEAVSDCLLFYGILYR
jgi:hypothetical protein